VTLLLSIFLEDILPIFLVAAAGFVLARRLHADVRTLSKATFNVLSPCLVFNLLVTSGLGADDFGRMALFTIGVIALIGLIAWLVTRPLRLERPTLVAFLLVVMFSNTGNYGLSAVMFAFGREALAHATVYFVMNAALMFTAGVFLASAGRRSIGQALSGVLKVPPVYAVALAGLVLASGVQVPTALMRPIGLLSDAAIPVMLLVLGMQLERGKVPERPALVGLAAVLALIVSPLLALGLADIVGLAGVARQAGIIQASMPAAVVTTILALEYDVAPSLVTSVVFVTTLLSPFTVTILIALLKQ
jgi:malate permease and related proteins